MTMKCSVATTLALLLFATTADAATLQGRIVNGTTGESARVDELLVFDLATSSTEPAARLQDVEGAFTVPDLPDAAAAHFRVEVRVGDATFSQPVKSFEGPMDVFVYDATDQISDIALLRHHVILSRDPEHMQVTEFLEFDNRTDPPRMIRASALPIRLELAHEIHGDPVASIMSSAVPVDVDLVAADAPAVFGLDHDLQPGSTRVVVRYLVHEEDHALDWSTRMLYPTEERRVMVSPPDVTVEAADMIPTESSIEGYAAWAGLAGAAGDEWSVRLSGGSAVAADTGSSQTRQQGDPAAAFTEIVARPNRLSESRPLIFLGLGGLLLSGVLGMLLSGRGRAAPAAASDPDRLAVSRVADRYVSGEITREEYEREAARLLQKTKKPGRHAAPVA